MELPVRLRFWIQTGPAHARHEIFRRGRLVPAHIKENTINGPKLSEDFGGLISEVILIGRGHVKDLPTRQENVVAPFHLTAGGFARHPFGMCIGGILVALNTDINRRANPFRMQRIDLSAQEIQSPAQPGMPLGALRIVI